MTDQLMILAEGADHASEGISPFLVGGGFLVILLCLLGITYLFSGLNQDHSRGRRDVVRGSDARPGSAHASSTSPTRSH